ncbi:MAG TPA: hypothetical protein VMK65_01960, partial [Longimicrobiales bacterium]|nr:hypothetical protein [Longimicrobiales bacterium]
MAHFAVPGAALLVLSVLLPAGLAAQEPTRPDSAALADSVAAADSVRPAMPALFGEDPAIRLGLKPVAPPFAFRFRPAPGLDRPELWPRFHEWARDWRAATGDRLEGRLPELWAAAARRGPGQGADSVAYLPPPPRRDTAAAGVLPGELGELAELGMVISGRGEMGGSWNRYEPCDATSAITCNPSLFPQLKPDVQFGVQVGGTVSDRVHINVDYDQRREFDAANNIHVYYQGFEDEILRRLEVGDVSLNLPASRFLTQGIPAGNFGFKATGQVGPLDFQTVWAQQKGDVNRQEFRRGGGGGGQEGLAQDLTLVRDDADYVQGQFFYVVHPDSILGAPHIDPLSLRGADAPAALTPRGAVAVFRYEGNTVHNPQQQGNLGYFRADGVSPTRATTHSGLWRRLNGNEDYQVHPSGLWLVLRSPLGRDEALAISYETSSGRIIGALNPEGAGEGTTPELLLIRGPAAVHQPGHVSGTWKHEMHQVYRLDSSDGVETNSVELEISLGESSSGATYVLSPTTGEQVTYLRLFGLDEDSPSEKLDAVALFRPRDIWTDPGNRLGGVYVVFPTLEPFRAPPPVPSAGLSDEEAALALGNAANAVIYDEPDPVTRGGAARYRLNFAYRVRSTGQLSSFSLGALGIREGSEKIYLNDQQLRPGQDYTIDYDIGEVILNNPDQLLGADADPQIRASWEQKALFALAPTSVFGLNGRYLLGERGELNFISLYQSEKSLMSRPQLGTEPGAIFLNGVSGNYALGGALLDRVMGAIPGLKVSGLSSADLRGEIALSSPNPNTRGETYLDDFEATDEVRLGVGERDWRLGSAPASNAGDEGVFPAILDVSSAG